MSGAQQPRNFLFTREGGNQRSEEQATANRNAAVRRMTGVGAAPAFATSGPAPTAANLARARNRVPALRANGAGAAPAGHMAAGPGIASLVTQFYQQQAMGAAAAAAAAPAPAGSQRQRGAALAPYTMPVSLGAKEQRLLGNMPWFGAPDPLGGAGGAGAAPPGGGAASFPIPEGGLPGLMNTNHGGGGRRRRGRKIHRKTSKKSSSKVGRRKTGKRRH